jgi:hypothetical protein
MHDTPHQVAVSLLRQLTHVVAMGKLQEQQLAQ